MSLCAAGEHSPPLTFVAAPVIPAARHIPPAGYGRRQEAEKEKFKQYPIGYFHIDIAEVRTEEGKLYMLVAIDRTSKFAFVELHEKATRRIAGDFLRHLIAAVPYKVHTVLTDNGTHFTDPKRNGLRAAELVAAIDAGEFFHAHSFELACAQNGVDHRLTKPCHPCPPNKTGGRHQVVCLFCN